MPSSNGISSPTRRVRATGLPLGLLWRTAAAAAALQRPFAPLWRFAASAHARPLLHLDAQLGSTAASRDARGDGAAVDVARGQAEMGGGDGTAARACAQLSAATLSHCARASAGRVQFCASAAGACVRLWSARAYLASVYFGTLVQNDCHVTANTCLGARMRPRGAERSRAAPLAAAVRRAGMASEADARRACSRGADAARISALAVARAAAASRARWGAR